MEVSGRNGNGAHERISELERARRRSYKLWYFDLRGRAETIRLIFAQAGVEYEDVRFSPKDWPEIKPKMPWHTVPVLEIDGKMVGQSGTICRYLAAQFGLAGTNDFDRAIVDSIGESITDIREKYSTAFSESDESRKAELKKIYREKTLPPILNVLDKVLGEKPFFVGEEVTWPDLHFYACLELVQVAECSIEEALSDNPNLISLFNRVKQLPNVASWLERRPETKF
ncbi:hypothetical protein LSH36_127g07006 [Paralvinella palmiformis]|uniref:glutathione transferase n=1 Tax=Paralvinella palmiformis TaxID=53620 RepID=A0AAD9N9U2_9ANNE|nr:hypothetical protein LSH36_127g07006 [Paralvinella palmiformis]